MLTHCHGHTHNMIRHLTYWVGLCKTLNIHWRETRHSHMKGQCDSDKKKLKMILDLGGRSHLPWLVGMIESDGVGGWRKQETETKKYRIFWYLLLNCINCGVVVLCYVQVRLLQTKQCERPILLPLHLCFAREESHSHPLMGLSSHLL